MACAKVGGAVSARDTSAVAHPAGSRRRRERYVSQYTDLCRQIRESGLLKRCYGYYWTLIISTVAAFAGVWVCFVFVGDSWFQLLIAAALGVILAQFGFLGHDAAHRQIFASNRWNEWASRVISGLFVGLSYGWWHSKHNRHHANPNREDHDPDVAAGAFAFTPDAARRRHRVTTWLTRRQGYYFFPLLLLEGLSLHVASIQTLVQRRDLRRRWVDATFIATRFGGYFAALLIVLPPSKAAAFLGVQMGLFGLILGGSFAPNHVGMPIVRADTEIDFLERQVLMSRNVRGGPVIDIALGGLNHQIEHHLFPNMARPLLRKAQPTVRDYCAERGISYTETGLFQAYRRVIGYLNEVGHPNADPYHCPITTQYRT